VLAVAAILLIVNTVQVAAFTRRTEVSIMRLVGATRWYTQLPFLLEAVVAAFIGSLLAIGGLFAAKVFFFDKALHDLYGVNILARITAGDVLFV
ncbi:FtsX-like permease family protein, partial [Mycobacterium tuberculosis]|nr:FtsX-like permease family protein [Mycobacterium tuberculosis]